MFCKMDVDDHLVPIRSRRVLACRCLADPGPRRIGAGCRCTRCGAECGECAGFGVYGVAPRRFHAILASVKASVNRKVRTSGRPPGFVRLRREEVEVVLAKYSAEDEDHWIRSHVEVGPPLTIYGVIVVTDRRKRI